MSKFAAQSIKDLMTVDANRGRVVRTEWYKLHTQTPFIAAVCIEADDGSWCELDAESEDHAKALAKNMVDHLNARGASCWKFDANGKLARKSFHVYFADCLADDQANAIIDEASEL